MIQCRLIPQTAYGMCLSQFSQRQCHQLDVRVLQIFYPLLVVKQSMPRAVLSPCPNTIWWHEPPQAFVTPRPMGPLLFYSVLEMGRHYRKQHHQSPRCFPTSVRVCDTSPELACNFNKLCRPKAHPLHPQPITCPGRANRSGESLATTALKNQQ